MKRFVAISSYWVERCREFGIDMVAWYDSDEGRQSASRAVSGNRGTERDPIRQGQGKLGEVAVAIYFNLNPEQVVNFARRADNGSDILLPCDLYADVKTSFPHYNLIWNRDVNHLYWQKRFDIIISVSVDERDWHSCWLAGFIDKADFFMRKRIADGKSSPRLEVNTWWFPKNDLNDIEELKTWKAPAYEMEKFK